MKLDRYQLPEDYVDNRLVVLVIVDSRHRGSGWGRHRRDVVNGAGLIVSLQ